MMAAPDQQSEVGTPVSASSVASLLAALAIIITAARLLGALARRVGQPAVVGEILAGVILGPTFFGAGLADHIFPLVDVRPALSGIGDLGLALFMFIIGYELDLGLLRSGGRTSVTVSLASIAAPLALGIAVGFGLAGQQHVHRTLPFALFVGVATAITAFPVLARILADRGMQRTAIGSLAVASAAINDVCAWTLLAIVLVVARVGDSASWRIVLLPGYVLVMALAIRPALRRLTAARDRAGRLSPDILAVVVVGLLASAYATEWMGLNFIFGAFLFGALMPREAAEQLRLEILARLEQLAVLVLLPVYFVLAGLSVNLSGFGSRSAVDLVLILAVAIGGKFGGTYLAARAQHLSRRPASALATLMNTRGLTEIVILTVGLQLGILGIQLYSLMVVMALVTTAMAGPLLNICYPARYVRRDIAAADRALLGQAASYRVLVALGNPETDDAVLAVASALARARDRAQLIVSGLLPYPRVPLELGTGLHAELAQMAQQMTYLEGAAEPLREHGVEVTIVARFAAEPAAELAELSSSAADVLVISACHPDFEAVAGSSRVRLVAVAAAAPSAWTAVVVRARAGSDGLAAADVGRLLAAGRPARLTLDPAGLTGRALHRLQARLTPDAPAAELAAALPGDALTVAGQAGPTDAADVFVRAEPDYDAAEPVELKIASEPQEVS
jgi:Kef-type K+ transport system membrane component KefB